MTATDVVGVFLAAAPVGVVEVRGTDRASFLNAVLSQEIEALPPGRWASALFLEAHGTPLAAMDVVALDDRIVLLLDDVPQAHEFGETLRARTFLAQVTITAEDATRWAVRGEAAGVASYTSGRALDPGEATEVGDVVVLARHDGHDVVAAERPETIDRLLAAGARDGDARDLHAWRVAHGEPQWAREIKPPHLPEELGLLPTHVHLQKGCYPGQEAVARMWMLGRPRRRLATVALLGGAAAGWTWGEGKQRVEVTSDAIDGGQRLGLALVPADARPHQRFGDEDAGVVVRELVGEGAPVPGWDPTVVRRRDRR